MPTITGSAGCFDKVQKKAKQPECSETFSTKSHCTYRLRQLAIGNGSLGSPGRASVMKALFIEFTPNFADQISKAAPDAIFGMFLIALMYLMPKGAIGVLDFIGVRLRRVAVAKRQN